MLPLVCLDTRSMMMCVATTLPESAIQRPPPPIYKSLNRALCDARLLSSTVHTRCADKASAVVVSPFGTEEIRSRACRTEHTGH